MKPNVVLIGGILLLLLLTFVVVFRTPPPPAKWDSGSSWNPADPPREQQNCEWPKWSNIYCTRDGNRWRKHRTQTPITENDFTACPSIDCVMTEWENVGTCSRTGKQLQTRSVKTNSAYNGIPCGDTQRHIECGAVDCEMSDWSDWSLCDPETGLQTQSKWVIVRPVHGGRECHQPETPTKTCAVDCLMSGMIPSQCVNGYRN